MKYLHVRHSTSLIEYNHLRILVDPVLSNIGEYPSIAMSPNKRENPLTDLKTPIESLLNADAVLCTHTHNDHFDKISAKIIDKEKVILCQSEDVKTFIDYGFKNIIPIKKSIEYKGITILRVKATHGTGLTGKNMGIASGYIIFSSNEPTIYLLGDTIYNDDIKKNILNYKPDLLVINGGSAKFLYSSPIVMNNKDIEKTLIVNPLLKFIIIHLDTFNHCIETRKSVKNYFTQEKLSSLGVKEFLIPDDNESFEF